MPKSHDRKLAEIKANPKSRAFINAEAEYASFDPSGASPWRLK
jgi:hypothetical protein